MRRAIRSRGLPHLEPGVAANLRLDVLYSVLSACYFVLPNTFVGVVGRNLGAEPIHLGIYWAFAYSGMFVAVLSGTWLPRGGLLLYAAAVGALGRALAIPAPFLGDPLLFLIVMAVSWSSVDIIYPILGDVRRRIYPLALRGQLIAAVRMASVATALVAAPLFGGVLDRAGPGVLFPICAALGIVGSLVFARIRVPPGGEETQNRFTPRQLVAVYRDDPRMLRWLLGQALWYAGTGAVWPILPIILVDRFHATYTQVGLLATITALASVTSFPLWGRVADRRSPILLNGATMAGAALVPLVYLLAPAIEWLALAAIAHGLAFAGAEVAGFAAFARIPPPGLYIRYQVAVTMSIGLIGPATSIAGPTLAAQPWFGPGPLLLLAALLAVAGGVAIGTFRLEPPDAGAGAPRTPG